ncbi:MAG: amino acid adenylation domain-containing protein, partial [Lachnospiraceae bacterium]|nr:amino acid adenylation domain-containing protein [Lachnospiraceae bacterium]
EAFNGRPVSFDTLREYDTPALLASYLSEEGDQKDYEIRERYPLTKTQEGIYVECLSHPGTTIYNIPALLRLGRNVDPDRLEGAISAAIDAHPGLKARLVTEDGEAFLLRNDEELPVIERIRLDTLPAAEELVLPYELDGGRLYQARIYETQAGSFLFLDLHHIIADGASRQIIKRDIERAYAGETLQRESFTGFEAALAEEEERKGKRYTEAKEWYDSVFTGCEEKLPPPDPDLSGNRTGREAETGAGTLTFPTKLSKESVLRFCEESAITPNIFFNGVFAVTLACFSDSGEAVFTTIYNGRRDSRYRNMAAMLVKTLPVRFFADPKQTVKESLTRLKDQLEGAMEHDLYSFAEAARAYHIDAEAMFAWQEESFTKLGGAFSMRSDEARNRNENSDASYSLDWADTGFHPTLSAAKSALSVEAFFRGEKITFLAEYRPATYGEGFVSSFLKTMEQIASEMLKGSGRKLSELRPVSEETEKELFELYDTDQEIEKRPAYRLLQDSTKKYPDRVAVVTSGESLTYQELNRAANRLGWILRDLALFVGDLCAVMLRRGPEVYIARQGILKAGGAFLPIDPDYPNERISYILKDSGATHIITSKELYLERKELLDTFEIEIIFAENAGEEEGIFSSEDLNLEIPEDSLAYCIYTSGSTGKPKGVLLTQKNLVNFVDANPKNQEVLGYTERGRVSLAFAAMTFDVSVMEEFIPLSHGLTICLANDEERHDYAALGKLCEEKHVDILTCTPSFLANILESGEMLPVLQALKSIDIGAEAFPASLYKKIRAVNPEVYIMNGYGPTEATISCTMAVMQGQSLITIGKPSANMKVAIMDRTDRPVPKGALGEMVIVGAGVGKGYINLPEQTKKSFITLWDRPAYRSGDLARILHNNEIEFRGRMDNQVKLRGLRVELDEIENVLSGFPGIGSAVVVVRNNTGEDYLAGFYTAKGQISDTEVRDYLKSRLSDYMVPDVLARLEEMPLTANGKIDKKRLPEVTQGERQEYAAPENEVEEAFCRAFEEILKLDRAGANDDFFALGGTSLSAMRVVSFALKRDWDIVYKNVFDYPTPRKLSRLILGQRKPSADAAPDGDMDGQKPHTVIKQSAENSETQPEDELYSVLSHNRAEYLSEIRAGETGTVFLTGATGFLGIHVLYELLKEKDRRIICLARNGRTLSGEKRLKALSVYYFDDSFDEDFQTRIRVVNAEITDEKLAEVLSDEKIDTIINCAAVVKHFSADDSINRINVDGVKRLVELALLKGARLVQVSTESVAGQSVDGSVPENVVLTEDSYQIGQSFGTKYALSKFQAEGEILRAVKYRGLRAKIVRVGNLMGRRDDGEFQINFRTNGFMNRLRAYETLGCFPVDELDSPVEFSPVDMTAKALVLLGATPDPFTVFHADNCHCIHMANVFEVFESCGFTVDIVETEEYERRLKKALADEKKGLIVSSLISYRNNEGENRRYIGCNSSFTVKALYRLGFSWPVVTPEYVKKAILALTTMGLFE